MRKELREYQQEAHNKIMARMKEVTHPLLINMSVGAGKSLLAASILLRIEKAGYRALCLTMNSTLILQNHETYLLQGGNSGVYCSSLNSKDVSNPVIFASPHSTALAIKKNKKLSQVDFNLIIVDECQNVDAHQSTSMYMRIFNHYGHKAQQDNYSFRILGLTGTPYRGKAISICGESEFFKEEVVKIQMPWLIDNGYLTKPVFGNDLAERIDFSRCKVNSMGKFVNKDLEEALKKNKRISANIMEQVISIVESYPIGGAFIFCCTLKHVDECLQLLPDTARAITGHTPHNERKQILEDANNGKVRYLVNVATLLTGVDCPRFNVAAFCRPTESLTLFNQAIGRVLRLFPGKTEALILDYAQNLKRFQDFDDPIINEAIQPSPEQEKELIFQCYQCNTMNSEHARRCIGMVDGKRCDHYFEFKECDACQTKADITARYCRHCEKELINPNDKLSLTPFHGGDLVDVIQAKYWVQERDAGYVFHARYHCSDNKIYYESYTPSSEKAKNMFYGQFVKKHVQNSSAFYPHLNNLIYVRAMLNYIESPLQLVIENKKIKKKVFKSEEATQAIVADIPKSELAPHQTPDTTRNNTLETQNPT
jgi:DNA repair protein RadD